MGAQSRFRLISLGSGSHQNLTLQKKKKPSKGNENSKNSKFGSLGRFVVLISIKAHTTFEMLHFDCLAWSPGLLGSPESFLPAEALHNSLIYSILFGCQI